MPSCAAPSVDVTAVGGFGLLWGNYYLAFLHETFGIFVCNTGQEAGGLLRF